MAGQITHQWNGTTLIVTSDSGTSACDLKGEKGDMGIRGPQGLPGIVVPSTGGTAVNVVQNTGDSTSEVMSQKAVTDCFNGVYDTTNDIDRRLSNIEAVNEGVSYTMVSDSSVLYDKPIPAKAAPVIQLDKIGGASVRVFNNIIDLSAFGTHTDNGVTASYANGIITINGTATGMGNISVSGAFGTAGNASDKTVRLTKVGGTVTGDSASFCSICIINNWAMGVGYLNLMSETAKEENWLATTEQGENEIGSIAVDFAGGVVFDNYQIRVEVGYYELTDNQPTELRVMGKNLVPFPYYYGTEKTTNGITFKVNDDGSVTANGTATATAYFVLFNKQTLKAGTWVVSGCKGGSKTTYGIGFELKNQNNGGIYQSVNSYDGSNSITLAEDTPNFSGEIFIASGVTVNNVTFYPQLERGDTATAYTKPSQTISTTTLPYLSDLIGWGQGVPSVGGNYIEFTEDGKAMYQRTTERMVLTGTEKWYSSDTSTTTGAVLGIRFYTILPTKSAFVDHNTIVPSVCNAYDVGTGNNTYKGVDAVSFSNESAYFYDAAYAYGTLDEWKAYVAARYAHGNPIVIEYALAEPPAPIDVTERFEGFDGVIETQPNGSLVVENENKRDLPTTLTYMASTRG